MPVYKVTDPSTGKKLRLTGDSPPTEEELNDIFSKTSTPALKKEEPKSTFKQRLGIGGTPEQRTFFGIPKSVERKLTPTATDIPVGEGFSPGAIGKTALKAGLGAAELVDTPTRILAKLRKNPETGERFKLTDPDAAFFRPEIEKVKGGIEKISPTLKNISQATGTINPALGALTNPKILKGATELVGSAASDPTLIFSLAKSLGKKGLAKFGRKKGQKEVAEKLAKELGEEVLPSAAKPKKGLSKLMSSLSDADRSMLSEPLSKVDKPFDFYADLAEAAVSNPRNPTPLDVAGRRAVEAMDQVTKQRQLIGKAKGELLQNSSEEIISIAKMKKKWSELLDSRLNATVKEGKIVNKFDSARPIKKPSELAMLEDINNLIKGLDDDIFVVEADDIKSTLRDIVDNYKATQARPVNTVTEGIGKELAKDVDNELVEVLGKDFKDLNKQYGNLKDTENFLNRRLGKTVTTEEGVEQAMHGASLLKSSLQSNSDRNTRILFDEVKKLTGIDLIKDAKFAEIAMKSVDDPRIKNLLEEAGRDIPGKLGIGVQTGSKVLKKLKKPPLKEARELATSTQKELLKESGEKLLTTKGAPTLGKTMADLLRGESEEDKKKKEEEEKIKKFKSALGAGGGKRF